MRADFQNVLEDLQEHLLTRIEEEGREIKATLGLKVASIEEKQLNLEKNLYFNVDNGKSGLKQ